MQAVIDRAVDAIYFVLKWIAIILVAWWIGHLIFSATMNNAEKKADDLVECVRAGESDC